MCICTACVYSALLVDVAQATAIGTVSKQREDGRREKGRGRREKGEGEGRREKGDERRRRETRTRSGSKAVCLLKQQAIALRCRCLSKGSRLPDYFPPHHQKMRTQHQRLPPGQQRAAQFRRCFS